MPKNPLNPSNRSHLPATPAARKIGFVWLCSASNRLRIGFVLAKIGFVIGFLSSGFPQRHPATLGVQKHIDMPQRIKTLTALRQLAVLATILVFALSSLLNAQFSGRLTGTVLDSSGAPIPNATVSLSFPGGTKALLATKTAADGVWNMIGIRPADYDISFEATGFAKAALRAIPVDPARETTVQTVTLQLPTINQSLDVSADIQSVQTSNVEISSTITAQEIANLPLIDRDPLGLVQMLPGVVQQGNSYTVINGLRTSYSNMTLDGINIQDNYLRDNALDYTPNRILLGQIRQMTLVTSNQNAAAPGGATQLAFETPSGGNSFHGSAYWYNRNNDFAANDWFNNQAGVANPRLNQNEAGGSFGGPIRKDKLFFYTNYEAVRTNSQLPQTETILTDTARQGIFTYQVGSATRTANLLTMRNISIDPYMAQLLAQVPSGSAINNYDVGDSTPALLRNTAGYRYNQRNNEVRDNVTTRLDYNFSERHVFNGSYIWNRDNTDRADLDNGYSLVPRITNPNHSHFLSLGWRWTPTATLTNELRGGFNLAPGDFLTSQKFGSYLITGMSFSDPVSEMLPQGRATNTWSASDNAAWQHGRHFLQFGFHMQRITVHSYDDTGIIPTYSLAMGTGQLALTRSNLPGITSADLANANQLLATLGGYIDSSSETVNVTSRTSGFVPGAGSVRNFLFNEYDLYAQDSWKLLPHLTLNLGLRWDLPGVVDESNSLELLPLVQNNNPVQTLLSNATLNFAGASVGRPWYNRDYKNFAPNLGLAWDVFGNGKTAFRGGYAITYVNDQSIYAPETMTETNSGLQGLANATGLSGRVSSGLPAIVQPAYQVPVTVAQNYATNPFNTVGLINPGLRTPYVQQYSAGIQQEFLHTVFEARYVGNHLVGGYRAFDYNQVNITSNGFLGDFINAQNNGNLALAANGTFNPAYNSRIPGSQPLPVFAKLTSGGSLANSTIRNLIQTGQAGALAATYQENGLNGSLNFFANPNALGADMLNNYSNSTYNSLQLEVRHRAAAGLEFNANYSFSKVLSDAAGDSQSRIEQFLDVNNPRLERARANFDLTHAIKGSGVYDLPFGAKHKLHYRPVNKVIEGWSVGAFMTWQSGAPFSILSGYGTLNRSDGSRSYYNTADTALTMSQLSSIVHFQMTGNGPMMIAQSAINPADGTGTNDTGSPTYTGQAFSNPTAGTLGVLQRRMFSGPWSFDLDASLQRTFRITERQSLQLRMEGVNVLNHPSFYVGDQNINSNTFGVISSMYNSPRLMQFAARYEF
jgi:hypothetical protein